MEVVARKNRGGVSDGKGKGRTSGTEGSYAEGNIVGCWSAK